MKVLKLLICGVLMLCSLIASLIAYLYLPVSVAIHWNLQGIADGFGPRWILLFILPILMMVTVLLFTLLPKITSKQFNVKRFEATYFYIMVMLVAFMAYVHIIMLWANTSGQLNIGRALVGGTACFFLFAGNVLGKVRRNHWLGIRTPWTLASEHVWYATHKFAADCMVIFSLLSLMLVFAGVAFVWCLSLLLLSVLMPVVYSYLLFAKLNQHDQK